MPQINSETSLSHSDAVQVLQDLIIQFKNDMDNNLLHGQIYQLMFPKMANILSKKGLHSDDADDILQDYFITDFKKNVSTYETSYQRPFFNYACTTLIRRMMNFWRSSHSKRTLKEDVTETRKIAYPNNGSKIEDEWLKELVIGEIKNFLLQLVENLENEKHKEVIILRLCMPFHISNLEIIELLGINPNTFSSHIRRSITTIRKSFEMKQDRLGFTWDDLEKFSLSKPFTVNESQLENIKPERIKELLRKIVIFNHPLQISQDEYGSKEEFSLDFLNGIKQLWDNWQTKSRGGLTDMDNDNSIGEENIDFSSQQLLNFMDNLEGEPAMLTRSSSNTSGDKSLDEVARLFRNCFAPSRSSVGVLRINFENYLKVQGVTLAQARAKFGFSTLEISNILQNRLSEKLRLKVESLPDWSSGEESVNERMKNVAKKLSFS